MRRAGLASIGVGVLVLAACSVREQAGDPLEPDVYLDRALAIVRANALYAPALDWPAVSAKAHRMAANARTADDTHGAITYVIRALEKAGDLHARFAEPDEWKLEASGGADSVPSPPPAVSLVKGRLGSIVLPDILSSPRAPNSFRYARTGLRQTSALQAKYRPCGWIVDLRENIGGDMVPMLLSVAPILGQERVIGFSGRKGLRYYVSYSDNTLSAEGERFRAPLKVSDFAPAPPVAVLTGPYTASAGEVVAVAFRARPNTRSFGMATKGVTTGPLPYRLADGAALVFAVSYYVDRDRTVYRHPIKPDVSFSQSTPATTVERAAQQWLLSADACSEDR